MKISFSKKEFLAYLVEQIRNKKVSFFTGAGISKNSGLPLAKEFESYLLQRLCNQLKLTKTYGRYSQSLNLPFELFVDVLSYTSKNFFDSFLDIFRLGKPNANHYLISKLMKESYVSEVLTTNFDTLLEEALRIDNVDFSYLFNEKQFRELDYNKLVSPVIFKIHGSVNHPNSVRSTLRVVASKVLLQSRTEIFSYFFDKLDKDIVFLGYSCSDELMLTSFSKT